MPDIHFQGNVIPAALFQERAGRAAAALKERGLGAGSKVAILLPNGATFLEAYLGVSSIGSVPVPISTHLVTDDYAEIFTRQPFDAILVTEALGRQVPAEQAAKAIFCDASHWDRMLGAVPEPLSAPGAAPEARFFTSGSTGIPKTVVRSLLPPDIAALRNTRFRKSWGIEDGMRTAVTGPLYHQAPLYHVMGALQAAERIVILDRFDPQTLLGAIEDHSLSHLHLVPSMMMKIASFDQLDAYDCSSLKFVLHGAAHCPRDVKLRLIERWGPIFREYYATSEFGMVTQIDTPEWLERPESVGRAFEGVDLEIRDIHSGELLPPAELGRIYMRSDDMPDFYYVEGSSGPGEVHRRGDFVTVDDVGFLDKEGYLYLTGRTDDIANISGIKFSAEATRLALLRNPAIDDAFVSVVADAATGEAFEAAVKLRSGSEPPSSAAILAALRPHLPRLAMPKAIRIVETLPVHDTGKSIRRYLEGFSPRQAASPAVRPGGDRLALEPRLPAGVEVVHLPVTGSTNADAVEQAESATGSLRLHYADAQTSGRGRQDRTWTSPPGNLYWTMLVDCRDDPARSLGLVYVTALAVRYTVDALTPADAEVETKWPNDTLVNGRKVSGVRIESTLAPGLKRAVGVGINVETFPYGTIYPATSLRAEGSAASRDDALLLLTANFISILELWRRDGFEALKPHYLAAAYRLGQSIPVRQDDGSVVTGVYEDVTEEGIVLRLADGEVRTMSTGDIISPPDKPLSA